MDPGRFVVGVLYCWAQGIRASAIFEDAQLKATVSTTIPYYSPPNGRRDQKPLKAPRRCFNDLCHQWSASHPDVGRRRDERYEHAEVSSIAAAAARPLGSATIAITLSFRAVNDAIYRFASMQICAAKLRRIGIFQIRK